MFRVVPPPIIRRAYNCIYSIWYLSHCYCYPLLSWRSWNFQQRCDKYQILQIQLYALLMMGGGTTRNMQSSFQTNKLCKGASCWIYLDDWLTVHRSITLVDLQLDAQSYLFIYNTFIKILYMFRALPCSSSAGLRRNCIYDDTRGCPYTITTWTS